MASEMSIPASPFVLPRTNCSGRHSIAQEAGARVIPHASCATIAIVERTSVVGRVREAAVAVPGRVWRSAPSSRRSIEV